ncbi:MAG: branched-chain amino acid ABC transporter permease [Alphaproteobacteria bacterium]
MLFVQLLVNGVQVGALYALTAVGFSLIFGSTRIFHVAHGATFTLAGYIFYQLYSVDGLSWIAALAAAMLAACIFGVLVDRLVYAPIQRHEGSFFTVFVAAFGISIVAQNLVGTVFGRGFVSIASPLSRSVRLAPGLYVPPTAALSVVAAVVCFAGLHLFLTRTHVGIALRALSENPELVRVFGLEPRRLSSYAFALGSLLVVPGALLTGTTSGLNPALGNHVLLISLAATIVGGVGSLRGAACGGLLLGLAENLALWRLDPQWSEAVTFVVLFLFIVFRPAGFFGRAAVQ